MVAALACLALQAFLVGLPSIGAEDDAPREVRLPTGGKCPDALASGKAMLFAYGDGKDAWFGRNPGAGSVRINSQPGTVTSGGERGPRIALAGDTIVSAWQGDYRQGPHVWFSRSRDGGKSFEPQRDLLVGQSPGLDEVALAAQGSSVAVFWLDGRSPQRVDAPVTNCIWYSLSLDGGKTFGPNRMIQAEGDLRACACCSLDPEFIAPNRVRILYRSGIRSERDIFAVEGSPPDNRWAVERMTSTHWTFEGCPMDGPRQAGTHWAYTIEGKCYADGKLLGAGKYASVSASGLAIWQDGDLLRWRDLAKGQTGTLRSGPNRAAVTDRFIIH